MNEYERLLNNELKKNNLQSNTELAISSIHDDVAREFGILTDEEESRTNEIEEIQNEMSELKKQLRKYRNINNPKMKSINEKRSIKRKEINKRINFLKLRLDEIEEETKD